MRRFNSNDLADPIIPRWKNSPTWMAMVLSFVFGGLSVVEGYSPLFCAVLFVIPFVLSWAGVKWL